MSTNTELIARVEPFVHGLGKAILRETVAAIEALEINAAACVNEYRELEIANEQLQAKLAAAQGQLVIPSDVREMAEKIQKNVYRAPLSWAAKVIDFVADYAAPIPQQPAEPAPSATVDHDELLTALRDNTLTTDQRSAIYSAMLAAKQAQPERAPLSEAWLAAMWSGIATAANRNTQVSDYVTFARAVEAAIKQGGQQVQPEPQVCINCLKEGKCMNRQALCPIMLGRKPWTSRPAAQPRLKVRLTAFPESNGKRNWTALLVREQSWDGLVGNCGGISLARGEYWNRVAYEAECARFLIGERDTEPSILDYGNDIKTPEEWKGELDGGRKPPAINPIAASKTALEYKPGDASTSGVNDFYYPAAVDLVRKYKRGSISYVQRHLRIGYNRAAAMIEAMEVAKLITPWGSEGEGRLWIEPSPAYEFKKPDDTEGGAL